MALIDKASLLFVPSVVAEGKAFNVLPSGNRAPDNKGGAGYDQTRADFDFDRGSNAAATRIGSDGLIKKYRENLLLQSNNFGTTWQTINASVTSGQSGYDGGSDAWLLTSTGGPLYQSISESGVVTFSVYAKANIGAGFLFRVDQTTQTKLEFNISTGAFISGSNYIDYNSTTIGGGWYRLSVTFLAASTSTAQFRITDGSGTNISGSAFIQSAQMETGLVATDYLDSTSVTGKAGVLVDLPRINYDANGENGALLLEGSRANLIQYSEYFDGWSKATSGTGSNPVLDFGHTSPEGVDNAYKVTFNKGAGTTTSDLSVLQTSFTSASNTASFYVKADAATRLMFRNSGTWAIYDITTEWTRIEKTDTGGSFQIGLREGYGLSDVPNSCSVYLYGAQVEANATYASSYIPNHGESGGVTRAADNCSVTGASDVIGQTEGTIYWEGIAQPNDNPILVQLIPSAAGNYTNTIYLEYVHSSTEFKVQAWDTGVKQVQINTGAVTAGQVYKLAFAYKANDFALYMNGTQIGTDTSGSVQSGLDKIGLGSLNGTTNAAFYGSEAKQTALFKERLSNAELAALTA